MGSEITTGFTEIDSGAYMWDYSSIPTGFRGGVRFYTGVSTFKAFAAFGPEDVELIKNTNTAVAALPTAAAIDTQLSGTHGSGAWDSAGSDTDPLEAVVPGSYVPGTAGFQLGLLTSDLTLTSSAPVVTESGDIELVKGQDYKEENAQQITFTSTSWPALGNASIWIEGSFTSEPIDMSIVQYGATQIVSLNLDDQATADLPLNRYRYSVFARLSDGNVFVLATGRVLFV